MKSLIKTRMTQLKKYTTQVMKLRWDLLSGETVARTSHLRIPNDDFALSQWKSWQKWRDRYAFHSLMYTFNLDRVCILPFHLLVTFTCRICTKTTRPKANVIKSGECCCQASSAPADSYNWKNRRGAFYYTQCTT